MHATQNAQGWDTVFATNHLGPFVLTEELMPHLADGANIVFVCSGVEDPERRPAAIAGFRGSRYISAEASARGEWKPGGSALPGGDAYATSKQCELATALAFARDPAAARQRRRAGLQPGHRPVPRRERLPARPAEVRAGAAGPVHQVLEHATAGREGYSPRPAERARTDRRLLRRTGQADARLNPRTRPAIPGPRRHRDARPTLDSPGLKASARKMPPKRLA